MHEKHINQGLELLKAEFGTDRVRNAVTKSEHFQIEIPSWIFGAFGGGRFGEYLPPACARNIDEKLDDAEMVNKVTGCTSAVAMHSLWDFSEDGYTINMKKAQYVAKAAAERSLQIGSVSPTYFLRGSFQGSFSSLLNDTRQRYIEHTIVSAEIAEKYGCNLLTLWFPDGSSYPAQINLAQAYDNMKCSILAAYEKIRETVHVLIEYKLFEPGTYSTVIPDWGTSFALVTSLGDNAGVLVDMGHHAHGTNIEQIIAILIQENIRCGLHFNTRYAADDDLAVEPTAEVARIFYELVAGDVVLSEQTSRNWFYMVDQCSSRENRIQAIIHSVDSLQMSLAKALLVDEERLSALRGKDEILLANRAFNEALIHCDVRPVVMAARLNRNLPADPMQAYVQSGYQEKIEKQRK